MSTMPPAPPAMPAEPGPAAPAQTGALGTVSMALGIAALTMALIPFYGIAFAVPLAVAALVLALVARPRPNEIRRHTTVGIVTASISFALVLAWIVAFTGVFGLFSWGSSSSSISTSSSGEWYGEDSATGQASGDSDPLFSSPTDANVDVRDGLAGAATLAVGEQTARLELAECTFASANYGGYAVRGTGPDGTFAATYTSDMAVVELAMGSPLDGTYIGNLSSMSASTGGGLFLDGEAFEGSGTLRRLEDDMDVSVEITVDCG